MLNAIMFKIMYAGMIANIVMTVHIGIPYFMLLLHRQYKVYVLLSVLLIQLLTIIIICVAATLVSLHLNT